LAVVSHLAKKSSSSVKLLMSPCFALLAKVDCSGKRLT
jgi:hypothetical protein